MTKQSHRERMAERRAAQLRRKPGFDPVPSARALSAPNPSRLYSYRPSKSDSAAYRKPFVRDFTKESQS